MMQVLQSLNQQQLLWSKFCTSKCCRLGQNSRAFRSHSLPQSPDMGCAGKYTTLGGQLSADVADPEIADSWRLSA